MANLADLVHRAAQTAPTKTALISGAQTLTWAEFDELVSRIAGGLVADGLEPGDRVGLRLPNSVGFAAGYFAILRAGLVAVPFNISYTESEVDFQVGDSGADFARMNGLEPCVESLLAGQPVSHGCKDLAPESLGFFGLQ